MTVYLPSGMDEFAPLTLEEAVYQAIGAASMCWEDVAKAGVFDSDRAKAIGDALLRKVAAPHSTGTDTGGPCCECCHEVAWGRAEDARTIADLEARLAECREEAHRMVEAARAEVNTLWESRCEEGGNCVRQYEPSGIDEFASNERTDHLPLVAPPGWNQVEETVDEYWAAMAKADPDGPQP